MEWGSYIISIAKTASKKIGVLICSMKFLTPEIALYLYKSTIQPCMEYCCYVWAGHSFLPPKKIGVGGVFEIGTEGGHEKIAQRYRG